MSPKVYRTFVLLSNGRPTVTLAPEVEVKPIHYVTLAIGLALIACRTFAPSPPPPVDIQATFERVRETLGNAPAPPGPPPAPLPEEAILILTPGGGPRLVGEGHVEGIADPTFEQNLVVQVVALREGRSDVIAHQPVTLQAELGQRGPFAAAATSDSGW